MKLSNDTFDFLRFLAEIGITAIGAFYKGVAEIWELPYGEAVLATSFVISTLLGVFVEWQRKKYKQKNEFFSGMEDK